MSHHPATGVQVAVEQSLLPLTEQSLQGTCAVGELQRLFKIAGAWLTVCP